MTTDHAAASAHNPSTLAEPSSVVINKSAHEFDKTLFDSLLSRRFFFAPSFEIYGGCAGFFDYGPPGSALQANILEVWRKHFIIEEDMLELDTTIMTLSEVLKTSGHVDKFTDWMVKDIKTGEIFRADHLVEAVLEARLKGNNEARGQAAAPPVEEDDKKKKKKKVVKSTAVKLEDDVVKEYEFLLAQIDNYTGEELGNIIKKHNIVNPETGNELSQPQEFNLMFQSEIGPTGQVKGYLRPETAQGHFINFQRLLEFNNGRVPFASAQIGRSFRNEISPRQGLLRVREFTMAEIEHYVDPKDKSHPRFVDTKDVQLQLLPKDVQERGETTMTHMTVGDAVGQKIVDNETLGYFLGRVQLFLEKIGIDPKKLRCRQHMGNEMAHYASDCWDFEIQSSYGWIECVGCADRSAYDLTVHSNRTKQKLVVKENLTEPNVYQKLDVQLVAKPFGMKFKKDAKAVEAVIRGYSQEELAKFQTELAEKKEATVTVEGGAEFVVTEDLVKIEEITVSEHIREYTPNVIEPSFGIGRILYSLLEHSYWARENDVARGVLSLPPVVAPIKCLIVPLSANSEFTPLINEISAKLRRAGVASRVDASGASIGKRYARNDELGTPYGCTIDFASVANGTLTLRERDSTDQLIGKIDDVIAVTVALSNSQMKWSEACEKLEKYSGTQEIE
ncbi:Glycine--tRNA ligase 1, mitochondrial [Naganishia albida]|nr:Glycine--tRNA ligase 1, mitochondrial [Naganishia albida]